MGHKDVRTTMIYTHVLNRGEEALEVRWTYDHHPRAFCYPPRIFWLRVDTLVSVNAFAVGLHFITLAYYYLVWPYTVRLWPYTLRLWPRTLRLWPCTLRLWPSALCDTLALAVHSVTLAGHSATLAVHSATLAVHSCDFGRATRSPVGRGDRVRV